jgi:predicted RNase H-like nuclease (RuvC/YqgF family)
MSKIPDIDNKPKYNTNKPYEWVDSQWEKFMTEQKQLKKIISDLEDENKMLRKKEHETHFDIRNQQITIKMLERDVLEKTMEMAEMRDELNNHSCHAEADGLEVGNVEDYEEKSQLELFPNWEFTKSGV